MLCIVTTLALSCGNCLAQGAAKVFKPKKNAIGLWGYENDGESEYWWREAHLLGKGEELMNQGHKTEWLISAQYTLVAKEFSEGLAGVELNGRVGFIDKRNRYIIPPMFEPTNHLQGFSHGLAAVKLGDKYGFINKRGEFVIEPMFDYAENFGDNHLATVKMDKRFGAIDLHGDTIVPCRHLTEEVMKIVPVKNKKYREAAKIVATRYEDGFYDDVVKTVTAIADEVNQLIRDSSYTVTMPTDVCIRAYSDSLVGLGITGNDTLWAMPPHCQSLNDIGNGYFLVTMKNKHGLADAFGRLILPCIYEEIVYQPSEKLAIVTSFKRNKEDVTNVSGNRVGLYSITGAMILPCVLESLTDFYDGQAVGSIDSILGIVDINGQVEDLFIEQLLEHSNEANSMNTRLLNERVIGLRPTCAAAHNNVGIYWLEQEEWNEGMRSLKLAHKLAPDDEQIAANLSQAKADRKERRYNRVMNVLSIAGAVVDVASTTLAATQGGSYTATTMTTNTASSSFDSTGSTINGHSKSSATQQNDGRSLSNMQNERTDRRVYSNYDSMLSKMRYGGGTYNDSDRRDWQSKMRRIREKWAKQGVTIPQSDNERWMGK